MSNTEVYAPCNCGSGKKYKFCCLKKDREAADAARAAEQDYLDDDEDGAPSPLRDAVGRGPAAKMVEFVKPLMDESDGSAESMQKCLELGMICWNAALLIDETGDEHGVLEDLLSGMKAESEDSRQKHRKLFQMMIRRHFEMFPEEHEMARRSR
jgi:hypothetical protein